MNEPAQLPLRPNVCMLIFNHEHRLFLGERFGCPGVWQLPQGGVEPDLSEEENVRKEVHEELGLPHESFQLVQRLAATHEYEFDVVPRYAEGRWRGQRQNFWLVRFLGDDRDIVLDRYTPEFSAWCWCTPDEVRSRAEPKRRAGYEAPLREFEHFLTQHR